MRKLNYVYVVEGFNYNDKESAIFGVYTTLEKAIKVKEEAIEQYDYTNYHIQFVELNTTNLEGIL